MMHSILQQRLHTLMRLAIALKCRVKRWIAMAARWDRMELFASQPLTYIIAITKHSESSVVPLASISTSLSYTSYQTSSTRLFSPFTTKPRSLFLCILRKSVQKHSLETLVHIFPDHHLRCTLNFPRSFPFHLYAPSYSPPLPFPRRYPQRQNGLTIFPRQERKAVLLL